MDKFFSFIPGHFLPLKDSTFYTESELLYNQAEPAKKKIEVSKMKKLCHGEIGEIVIGPVTFRITDRMLTAELKRDDVKSAHCANIGCVSHPESMKLFCKAHETQPDVDLESVENAPISQRKVGQNHHAGLPKCVSRSSPVKRSLTLSSVQNKESSKKIKDGVYSKAQSSKRGLEGIDLFNKLFP